MAEGRFDGRQVTLWTANDFLRDMLDRPAITRCHTRWNTSWSFSAHGIISSMWVNTSFAPHSMWEGRRLPIYLRTSSWKERI